MAVLANGSFSGCSAARSLAAAPTVTTKAATSVTDLQATLKGTFNANGVGYWTCTFQYGKTTSTPFSPSQTGSPVYSPP